MLLLCTEMTTAAPTSTSIPRRAAPAGPWRKRLTAALKWALPSLALLAIAGGIARWRMTRPAPAVRYETMAIDRGPIAAKVTATGVVSALVTVLVGSQVSGRIDGPPT